MSRPCTWLVQATVRGETRARLEAACAENERPLVRINVVPFSPEMPDDMPDVTGPFVLYGYTTLLLSAFHSARWRAGVFFDPDVFRPSRYLAHWGAERMFNPDTEIMTMRQFAEADLAPDTRRFVKPDDDLKRFTGGVLTHGEFRDWYRNVETLDGSGDIGPDTAIVVCTPKPVGVEWRVFLLEGQVIGSSCYSASDLDLPLPPELEQFARDAARAWAPAPAFALDVTRTDRGEPRIIEANCINGSGLYFADTRAWVRALSLYQEGRWQ